MSLEQSETVRSFDYQWRHLPEGKWLLSDEEWRRNVSAHILDELRMSEDEIRGKTVLDAGCGQGRWSYGFEKLGCRVFGFDSSPGAIQYAKSKLHGKFSVANILNYQELSEIYGDLRFDIVWCFPEGTPVYGSQPKPIETVKVGDSLGNQKVTRTYSRDYEGKLIVLKVLGLPEIKVTPDHEILVTQFKHIHRKNKRSLARKEVYEYEKQVPMWKPAKDLEDSDWVIVPVETKEEQHFIWLRRGWKGLNSGSPRQDQREPQRIEIDYSLAKALGLWVAEGHLTNKGYQVWYTFGKHESKLANKLIGILASKGLKVNSYSRSVPKNTLSLVTGNKDLWAYLKENFGRGAKNKRIPDWLYKTRKTVIRGFIEGLWLGDGGLDPRRIMMRICTTSKQLAFGLLPLFYKLGIPASVHQDNRNTMIRGKNHDTDSWRICFSKRAWENKRDKRGRDQTLRSRFDGTSMFLPIQAISQEESKCKVYNLETTDNTYQVPFTVHNCWGVLHHTGDPEKGFDNLVKLLKPGGTIHLYLYGKKSFVNKFWRRVFNIMPLDKRKRIAEQMARLQTLVGRVKLNKATRLPVGMFHILFPFSPSAHSYFDAYSPSLASNHTEKEVKEWFSRRGLTFVRYIPKWASVVTRGKTGKSWMRESRDLYVSGVKVVKRKKQESIS